MGAQDFAQGEGAIDVERFEAKIDDLESKLRRARAALDRINTELTAGRACDDADLVEVGSFGQELRLAQADLPDSGTAAASVEELRQVVHGLRKEARAERRRQLRAPLESLASIPIDASGSLLNATRRQAEELLEPDALDTEENLSRAEDLALLVALNHSGSEEERARLSVEATERLPPECLPAIGLAHSGAIVLPEGEDQSGGLDAVASESEPDLEAAVSDSGAAPATGVEVAAARDGVQPDESSEGAEPRDLAPIAAGSLEDAEVVSAIGKLLLENRIGLAYWIAVAWKGDGGLSTALKALFVARGIKSPVGEFAGRMRELAEDADLSELHGDPATQLATMVAGLRGALVAPFSGASSLLEATDAAYAEWPALRSLIDAVRTAAQRGVSAAEMVGPVQDIVTAEDELEAVRNRARQLLALQKVKYQRASNVWRRWIGPDGWLGQLLTSVAEDRTEALEEVSAELLELRSPKALEKRLDETDRALRPGSRVTPIVSRARQKLLDRAEDGLAIAGDWVDISEALAQLHRRASASEHNHDVMERLRDTAQNARGEIETCWTKWEVDPDLRGAVARGTRTTVGEVLQLIIEGTMPGAEERPADELFGRDLLRVEGLALDPRFEPVGEPQLAALCAAAQGGTWEDAFEHRVEEGSFGLAARIVSVLRPDDGDGADRLETQRIELLQEERQYLAGKVSEVARDLESARRKGQISESVWLALNVEVEGGLLDAEQEDLRGVDAEIARVGRELERQIADGIAGAQGLFAKKINEEEIFAPYRQRFGDLLNRGEISTLEELLLTVERGDEPPSQAPGLFKQFNEFFPAAVEERQGIERVDTETLTSLIEKRCAAGAFDYSRLKPEEVGDSAEALKAWRRLSGPGHDDCGEDLATVLDFIGLSVKGVVELDSRGGESRRSIGTAEFEASPIGKAMIPAFGSAAHGRYRAVVVRHQMTDDAIVTRLAGEPGESPIVLLYLASALTTTARRGIAEQLRHRTESRAISVIDDAAFLYLTSKGGHRLATTMRISLPFTAVNPYTPFVAGSVPVEMFYGRRAELENISSPEGTSFIYGGRRLGKSALLRAAERRYKERSAGNRSIYLDLKSEGIGEWRTADSIIDLIARGLAEVGVMTQAGARRASFDDMREQLLTWLSADTDRRVLLLLDECDSFLNADAEGEFENVSKLKSLMEATERRFKPVLAGLHQVRRFERIPNQPLSHLGQPLPIGPLDPQRAYDLITKPMETLGYRFDSEELPARILTATNYQPSLIQLFCSELVEHMHTKVRGPDTPPYLISDRDLQSVLQAPHVTDEMRSRFELTINLDPRYRVIAYAVAHHALNQGVNSGLDPTDIREICDEYWPAGFRMTGTDEFLALLEEMDSLGILFQDRRRFFMRSPNVLRMLGTAEQIEDQLLGSSELEVPQGFEADSFRDSRDDNSDRRRPLTHQQVAGLLERRGQTKVVLGNEATTVEDVFPFLDELFRKEGRGYSFSDGTEEKPKKLLGRLRKTAKNRHRVVAVRTAEMADHEIVSLVRQAAQAIAAKGAPTTAIFILDSRSLGAWAELLGGRAVEGGALDVVELRRWTRAGLRAWAHSSQSDLPFHEDKYLDQLLDLTGGWPLLVDRLVDAYTGTTQRKWSQAVADLEVWLAGRGAKELCDATGITANPQVRDAWASFVQYDEPMTRADFQALVADESRIGSSAVDVLRALGVLVTNDEGLLVAEPTVAAAWRIAESSASNVRE